MSNLDIARALKDKDYFNTLTPDQQAMVREQGGVGEADVTDDSLESVSGGLGGFDDQAANATGTDPKVGSGFSSALTICNC